MSGVQSGTTSVVELDEEILSPPKGEVVDGEVTVLEESLSFPERELVESESVAMLWISVHVSATPVDSGVGVGAAGVVPEKTMTGRASVPVEPGNVNV